MNDEGSLLADRYRLEERIGSGGLAVVWRATDTVLGREVAIKQLRGDVTSEETHQRFQQEAVTAAGIHHPHAVTVYDMGEHEGRSYLVMELVEGPDLAEVIEEHGPLSASAVAAIGEQAGRALGEAHANGLIHRDVKPANILVTPAGSVKVTDFGIAKAVGDAQTRLTATGTVMGTALYLAPEQLEDAELDPRTDVYALGVVLWEALTGRVPFEGGTTAEVALARLQREVPRPSEAGVDVAPELDDVVARATRRDRDARYADGRELAEALAPLVGDDAEELLAQAISRQSWTAVLPWVGDDDEPRRRSEARTDERPAVAAAGRGDGGGGGGTGGTARTERAAGSAAGSTSATTRAGGGERSGSRRRIALLVVLALVATGLVVAMTGGTGSLPGLSEPEPVEVASATDFDPHGDGEHADEVPNLFDGDPSTTWRTQRYNSADLGGLKPGVGLHLDLGEPRDVAAVEIAAQTPGFDVELHGFEQPPSAGGEWGEPAARVEDAPGEFRLEPEGVGAAQHWVIWITQLPGGGGRHRAVIGELRVLAR